MPKVKLTDRGLQKLKPAPAGKRYELMDSEERGLGIRVTDRGQRTFVMLTRFPGARNPARRALGEYPSMTLAEARDRASEWRRLIKRGVDPQVQVERERRAAIIQQQNTFGAVAEDFIAEKLPTERKGREVERDIRRDLMPAWHVVPIADLSRAEIRRVIELKKASAPAQARNLLGVVKRMLAWAVDKECYGLAASPADTLKPTKIIGEKQSGDRILTDDELFALWRAAARVPYPYGPAYRLLILTGLRLNEAADASRAEFDIRNAVWIIPAGRMKGRGSRAKAHAVPLTADITALIDEVPRFRSGDFLFSTTFGRSPVWMSDKIKKRMDARMLRTLRALARRRDEDPQKVKLPRWTNHDIRRTVRSNLSALRVPEEVREAVLAHARPGIKGVYDLHDYLDEKREALQLWAARLRKIIEPQASNVVPFSVKEMA